MKTLFSFSILLLLNISASSQAPATLSLDGARLADIKSKASQNNAAAVQLTGSIIKQADKLLLMQPVSVMDKEFTPVSGNKHDYMSQAPYFWYDSSKPKGLPYLRRDGERNPEINKITDRKYIGDLESATRMLSLAWYFTRDEKYAVKSATLLKHWFLDPDYKMNPHLEYGQAIPGINTGRGIGIIETRSLIGVTDAATLLSGSAAWSASDMAALKQWFAQYLHWMLTSKNGKDEHAAKNNHGSWYFAQAITFALFSGDTKTARQLAEESKARLDSQLTADGRQPLELERTNSLGYSTMNLRAWFEVANLTEKTGLDLYNFKTSKGSGIRSALEWLLPYATGTKAWTYDQITPYNKSEFYPILLLANDQYKDETYLAAARKIGTGESILNDLLFPITSITPQPSTHIARITEDSIIVIKGTSFSFTVDTPEDKGLVSITTTTGQLLSQLSSLANSFKQFAITDGMGSSRNDEDVIQPGDKLFATTSGDSKKKAWSIGIEPGAIGGRLWLSKQSLTVNTSTSLILYYTVGQRTPNATVKIYFPPGILLTDENTSVNVIGRGEVKLKDLATQSIGRAGTAYPIHKVGNFAISKTADGGSVLLFKHLDLRPSNGADLRIVVNGVKFTQTGNYHISASYTTSKPAILTSAGIGSESALLTVNNTIMDFERGADRSVRYIESPTTYTKTSFRWSAIDPASIIQLQQSQDEGKTWIRSNASINSKTGTATLTGLQSNKHYQFRLIVNSGPHKGFSNTAFFYSGKLDIKNYNVSGDGNSDNTEAINEAISYLEKIGGGTLLFSKGIYKVRTLHLKSNVWLYVSKDAAIKAIKGSDAPETTWFSDKKYRSGLSPTDAGPYDDPENYMTKQDVGHHYFHNTMFFGERLDNIKIIGNGLITGDGNLVTGDRVMNNAADNRADKMFTLKLCTNLEIGGLYRSEDLWYDSTKDETYYITKAGTKDFDTRNMLQIDRAGHFVLLATGTDNIYVHDTYFAKNNQTSVRDIYDFMACNNVTATNIYSKVSSDDIIKPGSDCSLGFTRPARNYKVRNIIGDTNCNLFQIGSETADDIMDVHVDNIYVLGANKAGFSISTNDGGHVKDIHLNCGHTGKLHSRSKMYRSYAPFFISISNRGRILGASTTRFKFDENGVKHDELLVTNVDIGKVENVLINSIDIAEVYAGSSFGEKNSRWKAYDGSQKRATPIIAGYKLPDTDVVEGGLNFKLPNGNHTGYIQNIVFNDVRLLVKGGNSLADTAANPPELGVGQYNASNLKTEPSFGIWARHVKGLTVKGCTFNAEQPDHRYPIYLDDVAGAQISNIKMVCTGDNKVSVKLRNSSGVVINNASCSTEQWATRPF